MVIEVSNLHTAFGENKVHKGISFNVEEKAICAVIGGSGSGKSTLLNVLLGLLEPTKGDALLFGQNLHTLNDLDKSLLLRKTSVLFQESALFSSLSVTENIAFPLVEFLNIEQNRANRIARMWLDLVGLHITTANKYPSELSGGMKKRAALARALILEPKLLFLDEPTSGLDPIAARNFDQLISELSSKLNMTIFMISHDLFSVKNLSSQVLALKQGGIVANCTYPELLSHKDPWLKNYITSSHIEEIFENSQPH